MSRETILFRDFLGLQTALGEPSPNSARSVKNLVRNRHLGDLELGTTYDLKFPSDAGSTLPQADDLEENHWLDPAIHKITGLSFENIHNFYVPDHGGRNIAVAIGTYTKGSHFPGNPTIQRSGLFVRPYWDGLAWVDLWRELTEMFVFELTSLGSGAAPASFETEPTGASNDTSVGSSPFGTTPPWEIVAGGATIAVDDGVDFNTGVIHLGPSRTHFLAGEITNFLKVDGASLSSIPAGERVVGIKAFVKRSAVHTLVHSPSAPYGITYHQVRIVKNGVIVGDAKGDPGTTWVEQAAGGAVAFTTDVFGAADDTWGYTFDVGDTLGIALSLANNDADTNALIHPFFDYVYFEVYTEAGGAYRIYIDEGPGSYDFGSLDPDAVVFNAEYFKRWTIAYAGFTDDENYDLVAGCGFEGAKYYLDLYRRNTEFASRIVGTKLLLYRNFLARETPAALTSYCHNVLNEMRLTTGGGASDVALMSGFRTKLQDVDDSAYPWPKYDELVCGNAMAEDWPYAVLLAINGSAATGDDLLAEGTYSFKYAIVYDDGSVGRIFDAVTITSGVFSVGRSIVVAAPASINLKILRSYGAFPKRARGIAIYMSDDDVYYYKIAAHDLTDLSAATGTMVGGPAGVKHHFAFIESTIRSIDWNADIPEAQVDTGRSIADAGVIRYRQAAVIGAHTFAVGVYANGVYQPNRVYSSVVGGDGQSQYDIFPDDTIHALSVEYNDADEALSVIGLNNRIAVFKKRSIVLLRFSPDAGYIRDVITKGWGIASARTLVEYDGSLYWLDYAGVMRYNESGIELINREWLTDLLDMDDATKEAAIAVFDRNEKLYILRLNDTVYIYDLLTRTWMIDEYALTPERFAVDNSRNRVDFLAADDVYTFDEGVLHAGGHYDFYFESNEVDRQSPDPVDLNIIKLFVRYRASIDTTVTLYRNDTNEVLAGPFTLKKELYRAVYLVPDHVATTSFRWKVAGTAVDQNSTFRLQRIGFIIQPVEIRGDILGE